MSGLIQCKACGAKISAKAKACPHCGHPNAKHLSGSTVAVVFLLLGLFVYSIIPGQAPSVPAPVAAPPAPAKPLTPEEKAKAEAQATFEAKNRQEAAARRAQQAKKDAGLIWDYASTDDAMGRGQVKIATVNSMNTIELPFPYQGAQRGVLMLRQSPKHGKDVMLRIDRGQFLCRFDGCKVNVRFGVGQPVSLGATGAADQSTNILFIEGHDRFVANAKKVTTVKIEADFYSAGTRVFEFDVTGLQWP